MCTADISQQVLRSVGGALAVPDHRRVEGGEGGEREKDERVRGWGGTKCMEA